MVLEYVKKIAEKQINGMMKKMDIQNKVKEMINSDALKTVTAQAASLGLVDKSTIEQLENQALNLAKDPLKAAKSLGNELEMISNNPGKFAEQMLVKMEEKAVSLI